jgi:hypothetical protein
MKISKKEMAEKDDQKDDQNRWPFLMIPGIIPGMIRGITPGDHQK